MSFALNLPTPLVSKLVAGTDEGTIIYTLSGISFVDSNKKSIALAPFTLTNSCGSAMIVVVPDFNNFFDNSIGITIVDSICICASIKPGDIYLLLH